MNMVQYSKPCISGGFAKLKTKKFNSATAANKAFKNLLKKCKIKKVPKSAKKKTTKKRVKGKKKPCPRGQTRYGTGRCHKKRTGKKRKRR